MTVEYYSRTLEMLAEDKRRRDAMYEYNLKQVDLEFLSVHQKSRIGVIYELVNPDFGPGPDRRFLLDNVVIIQEKQTIHLRAFGRWLRPEDNVPYRSEAFPEWWLTHPAIFQVSENQKIGLAAPQIPRG